MPRRKQKNPPKFSGALAEPIRVKPITPYNFLKDRDVEKRSQNIKDGLHKESYEYYASAFQKLPLLLAHYGLSESTPNCWKSLCLLLARDFVPGFYPDRRKPSGRPKVWDDFRHAALYAAVRKAMKNKSGIRRRNISEACKYLAKKQPWKRLIGSKTDKPSDQVLSNEYHKACDSPFVKEICEMETNKSTRRIATGLWKFSRQLASGKLSKKTPL